MDNTAARFAVDVRGRGCAPSCTENTLHRGHRFRQRYPHFFYQQASIDFHQEWRGRRSGDRDDGREVEDCVLQLPNPS